MSVVVLDCLLAIVLARVLLCPMARNLRRPFAVAGECVRCLWIRSGVRKGMLLRNPRLAARSKVCIGGQKNA